MPFQLLTPPVKALGALGARFRDALFRGHDAKLRELAETTGDEALVQLIDAEDAEDKLAMFRAVPSARRAGVLVALSEYSQETILGALTKTELEAIVHSADSDEAVDVLQLLDDVARSKIVAQLRQRDPNKLLSLLEYAADTAGGIMQAELFKFRGDATIADVRRAVASATAAGKRYSRQLYVVDQEDTLVGAVAPLRLLHASPEARLAELMQPFPAAAWVGLDQEEVAKLFDEHELVELPVVGAKGKLVGVITAADVLSVMEKEYAEDISRLVGADEDDHIEDPVARTFTRRFPWLLVNLFTATVAASVVGLFQDTIQRVVILAAFMPIVAGLGGNAGTQTLGVVVRAMALGDLHTMNVRRTIVRQTLAAAMNGLATGAIMAGISFAWTRDATLALVVLGAMVVNMCLAGLGGAAVPVVMRALKIDPALASSIFVTALTDTCGFFVFLSLAEAFL